MPIDLPPGGMELGELAPESIDLASGAYVSAVLLAGGVTLSTSQLAILPQLVRAASREIIRYCGRPFALQSFDEIVVPEGTRQDRGEPASAKLSYFPVVGSVRCNTGRSTVLTIANTNTNTNQYATVEFAFTGDVEYMDLTYTGLILTHVASGVMTSSTLFFSDYVTITDLATAVNALGNGWTATVGTGTPSPGLFGSAELIGVREPKDALTPSGAALDVFTRAATGYTIDRASGIMTCRGWSDGGRGWGTWWPDGFGDYGETIGWGWPQYRVRYQAGFATVPEQIAQATAEVVKNIYARLAVSDKFKSQSGASQSENWSWDARDAINNISDESMLVLDRYRSNWI